MKFIIAISAMLSLATALPIRTSVDIQETGGAYTCEQNQNYLGGCISDSSNCPSTGVSLAQCQSLCDTTTGCNAIVTNGKSGGSCYLKTKQGTVSATSDGTVSCLRSTCASGYTIVIGDEPNWGHVMAGGSKKDTSSSGACGSMCDAQDKCLSYEWYPTRQVCNLNIVAQPSDPNRHEDSVYCIKKTTAPTAHPTFKPSTRTRVLPGWCREWRHQNTRQSREMHGTATYFTGTSVTQKSCIDRCDESPRCHQAVFEESGPWGPQCWLGNRKSSISPKGSRNCSNAPASRPRVPCVDFCYNKEGWD